MELKIIPAKDTRAIRKTVLRPGASDAECEYPGDDSENNFHLGAFEKEKLIGIASFYKENNSLFAGGIQFRLRGMATLPENRNSGAGRLLVQKGLEILKSRGAEILWCNARSSALEFYKKLNFATTGEEFLIENIGPHYVMYRKIEVE